MYLERAHPAFLTTLVVLVSINARIIFQRSRYIAFFLFLPKQKFKLKDYLKFVGEGIKNFAEFFFEYFEEHLINSSIDSFIKPGINFKVFLECTHPAFLE